MTGPVLAIETALEACSVALVDGGQVLDSRVMVMAKGQAEALAPLVAAMLTDMRVTPGQLDRIIVTTGPGSFTGIRSGLAFARSMALALDIPCIGIDTLTALRATSGLAAGERVAVAVGLAGSLFVAAWQHDRQVIGPARVIDGVLPGGLVGYWSVTGPGASQLAGLLAQSRVHPCDAIDPVVLARLGMEADPATATPDPLYLRGADAKLPGGSVLAHS